MTPPDQPTAHGWDMLGFGKLDFRSDRSAVNVTRKHGNFRTLRLHVGGTPLQMTAVRVVMADGSSYTPGTDLSFTQGSWTHHIALPAPARPVVRVEFAYHGTGRSTGNSTVRLFGQH
jgi:hypothetical protein